MKQEHEQILAKQNEELDVKEKELEEFRTNSSVRF